MKKRAFTLVEMLIVIVIIGILAAALIPRIIGMQAKARDSARDTGLGSFAQWLEMYAIDNRGYYPANNAAASDAKDKNLSTDQLKDELQSYMEEIPSNSDVALSVQGSDTDRSCLAWTNGSYAYLTRQSGGVAKAKWYALTVALESKTWGNTRDCFYDIWDTGTKPNNANGEANSAAWSVLADVVALKTRAKNMKEN